MEARPIRGPSYTAVDGFSAINKVAWMNTSLYELETDIVREVRENKWAGSKSLKNVPLTWTWLFENSFASSQQLYLGQEER